jgi:transposase
LLHLGEVVAVTVPGGQQEAAPRSGAGTRGLPRGPDGRPAAVVESAVAPGDRLPGGKAWTGKHELWLRTQRFEFLGLQLAYDAAFDAMLATVDRRDRLDPAIAAMAVDSMFTPVVTRLDCLQGVSRLTALGLAVEIGDRHRLSGRSIGAYLGLVPTVHRLSSPAASRMRLYVSRRPWGQNERNHFQLRSSSATFCSATIDGYFPSR